MPSPHVFFSFDYHFDKNGEQLQRCCSFWRQAVSAPGEKTMADGLGPIDLHLHDMRRSAHFGVRNAGVDGQTRRDIMGHQNTSMDDRRTMIEDEPLEDARQWMEVFEQERDPTP